MAGPEPYPQEKWTLEQEEAYAEGRKSAQGSSGGQPSRSGSRKKRYVRTEAGSRRYHVPIGAEIGSARNAKAAEAQRDTESTDRYRELVGGDSAAQSAAMRGLSDDQLQRLSQVAYSFRSSDQNVVRLRVGVANELARRGFNVNDFGGLGGGSTRPTGPKSAPTGGRVQAAMTKMYGPKSLSVPQLRKAVGVFSRVHPTKKQVVARFLVRQAIELSATHLIGDSVVRATNDPKVIELAGRWKHGYIPLDATALSEKMKGRTGGKKWWAGGGGKSGKRKSKLVAVPKKNNPDRIPGTAPGHEYRKQKDGTYTSYSGGRKGRAALDKGLTTDTIKQARQARANVGKPEIRHAYHLKDAGDFSFKKREPKVAKKPGVSGRKGSMARSIEAGKAARQKREVRQQAPQPKPASRHAGAKMSDRDFADLQNRRNAASTGRERANLTRSINAELQRRQAASAPKKGSSDRTSVPHPGKTSKPALPAHSGTVGKRIAGSPEGTQAYSVTGTSLYDTVLFDDNGNVMGFAKKRSGSSTVGRSGSATLARNKGYNMYDRKGNSMGSENTRARALGLIKTRALRNGVGSGKA